jgi:hypothetical protein
MNTRNTSHRTVPCPTLSSSPDASQARGYLHTHPMLTALPGLEIDRISKSGQSAVHDDRRCAAPHPNRRSSSVRGRSLDAESSPGTIQQRDTERLEVTASPWLHVRPSQVGQTFARRTTVKRDTQSAYGDLRPAVGTVESLWLTCDRFPFVPIVAIQRPYTGRCNRIPKAWTPGLAGNQSRL